MLNIAYNNPNTSNTANDQVTNAETTQKDEKILNEEKKILFIFTSHAKLSETGDPTGYYLNEVAHP